MCLDFGDGSLGIGPRLGGGRGYGSLVRDDGVVRGLCGLHRCVHRSPATVPVGALLVVGNIHLLVVSPAGQDLGGACIELGDGVLRDYMIEKETNK